MDQATSKDIDAWRRLYPFDSHFIELSGQVRLHYVDEGDGRPVLMVHGNPTWSFYYRRLIQALSPSHRTIAVDHIGCGLSDKPQDYRYQLSQHISNLVELIESLDLRQTTLIAHDWGGAIGIGAVQQCSDRFDRIVLLNTGAFPPPFIPFRIRVCRWPIFGRLALLGFNAFARAAVKMATEQTGGLQSEVAAGMLAPYDSWNNRIAIYQFVKDIPLSRSHPTWAVLETIERQLADLSDKEIHLCWGMKDWCFRPECLERFIKHWPAADVRRFQEAGHYVLEDAYEGIERLLKEWLGVS